MSDIGIRFDGLILLAALAAGTCVYLFIAVIALAVGLIRSHARARKIAGFATCMAIATTAATAAFFIWWDKHGLYFDGVDWIDALTVPWAAAFFGGCWFLARVR